MTWSCTTKLTSIAVSNLPESIIEKDLADLFGAYGEITRSSLIVDRATGESTGRACIDFVNEAAAEKAYQEMNNCLYLGHTLNIRLTHPRFPVAECTIKITNLPLFVILPDIEELFDSPCKPIVRSVLVTDTWNNAGAFAMIEFRNADLARTARKNADGDWLDGVNLKVDIARQSIDIDSLLVQ
jgi:RNA recognition motif-containing protein